MKNELSLDHIWIIFLVALTIAAWVLFYRVDCVVALYLISFTVWGLSIAIARLSGGKRDALRLTITLNLCASAFLFTCVRHLRSLDTVIYGTERLPGMHLAACAGALLFMFVKRITKNTAGHASQERTEEAEQGQART